MDSRKKVKFSTSKEGGGMFWAIIFAIAGAIGFGYWLRSKRPNKKELEKIDILEGWKNIVDGRIAEFKRTMTRDEKWAVVIGLSIMETAMIIVIIPALTGSMVNMAGSGEPGSLSWFFPFMWQATWWALSLYVFYLIGKGIWKMARHKVPCSAKEGEDKKGGE
jgi:hypothetical protein